MGNYGRFLNRDLSDYDYMTSGSVYKEIIDKERSFGFKGKCVEPIPHLIDKIKSRVEDSAKNSNADVQIIEIGGTLGDYQNLLFLEAARQMKTNDPEDVFFLIVTYIPFLESTGELKTRPTQSAIRVLNSYGISADLIIARCSVDIDKKRKEKISYACNIPINNIIPLPNVDNIYSIPNYLHKSGLGNILTKQLNLKKKKGKNILRKWSDLQKRMSSAKKTIKIAIIGKYFETGAFILNDSYISIMEAIKFSSAKYGVKTDVEWISVKQFEGKNASKNLKSLNKYNGIIVPGGFGSRGAEGKIATIKYARQNNIPILGICYGMQLMVVEYLRNVMKKKSATSIEINPKAKNPVITFLKGQKDKLREKRYGGTMRLGLYKSKPFDGTILKKLYKSNKIEERHRHRYEVNPDYIDELENAGLRTSSMTSDSLVEAVELDSSVHSFFIGTQYHPEFKARPFEPSPVFNGFIDASKKRTTKN